ncbi:NIPSNAP family protein [Brucella sp. JSBI001]|uniref:NIPSNAP family protein n=1 Tax=Brucella sp. JSBI001 TaxID=2886044 RepID=UPI00223030CB|nr:NIPSNAP family protein [Brucella sp. JSBI001]UZD69337.1 NIPSNAP family protein [Brucella sp. JSBI001]
MTFSQYRRLLIFLAMGMTLFARPGAAEALNTTEDRSNGERMIQQLRVYEIFERNKAAFHARFRDHAVRIMERHDFHIVAMWEAKTDGRTEFVYLLQWPDEATMTDRWQRFMADQEWARIKEETAAQHGQLVGEIQSRLLRLTSYSPPAQ